MQKGRGLISSGGLLAAIGETLMPTRDLATEVRPIKRQQIYVLPATFSQVCLWGAAAILPVILTLHVEAQPTQNQPGQPGQQKPEANFVPTKRPFKRDKQEFQVTDLKTPPELPGLPTFPVGPRAEFQCGQCAPNTHSGQIYTLTYRAKDPGPIILNWYEQAFRGNQWTANRIGNMINAEMSNGNGVRCNIFLLRAIKPGFQTNFVVLYTVPPPKK